MADTKDATTIDANTQPDQEGTDALRAELDRLRANTRLLKRVALALFAAEVLAVASFLLYTDQLRFLG